ncbi:hypothetical protein PO909_026986 [Leuciscus waleckii]
MDVSTLSQGGDDSGRSQGGEESRSSQAWTQRAARMKAHGGVDGGRSHGGDLADDNHGTTYGDEAIESGGLGADGDQMGQSDTDVSGDQGRAVAMND